MDHAGAQKAGAKLLGEVETASLAEFLPSLRQLSTNANSTPEAQTYFGIPELDALLSSPPARPRNTNSSNTNTRSPQRPPLQQDDDLWIPPSSPNPHPPSSPIRQHQPPSEPHSPPKPLSSTRAITSNTPTHPPILELISPPHTHHASSPGKTSLIYLITALAILPLSICGKPIGGKNATVVILDPLGHFCVERLVEVMASFIKDKIAEAGTDEQEEQSKQKEKRKGRETQGLTPPSVQEIGTTISRSLRHIHIFRPQSWASLLITLSTLPSYLFSPTRHQSQDRRLHTIVLEDMDAYYWSLRSTSTTTEESKHPKGKDTRKTEVKKEKDATNPSGAARLSTLLIHLSTTLPTSIIATSTSSTPFPSFPSTPSTTFHANTIRTPIPLLCPPHVPIARLTIRRIPVIPFRTGLSLEEALAEKGQRWDVVKRGRVECWKLSGGGGGGEEKRDGGDAGKGFVFRVTGAGVRMER